MSGQNTETDDVLDFINSLPDTEKGSGKESATGEKMGKDDELLDFLDELAQHEKSATPKLKFEPKKGKEKKEVNKKEVEKKEAEFTEILQEKSGEKSENVIAEKRGESKQEVANADDDSESVDPIGSISNWWNKEGSSKVNSFWGSLTNNAHQITEQTYQLASSTTNELNKHRQNILKEDLASKLNSLIVNVSSQITSGLMSQEDEFLNILLVYDVNLNYLDKLANEKFNKVMNQVEGGIKISVTNFNHNPDQSKFIDLNMFYGKLIDGEKLGFANLESSIKDFNRILAESKEKTKHLNEDLDISINQSNIFISVQPISTKTENSVSQDDGPIIIDSANQNSFSFTIILKDITNDIIIVSKTQPFPLSWAKWLNGEDLEKFKGEDGEDVEGVDPTEWVKDWIKEGISLSLGVVAQQYVIKRMGF